MYGIINAFSTVLHFQTLCHGVPLISRQIYVLIYEVSDPKSLDYVDTVTCQIAEIDSRKLENGMSGLVKHVECTLRHVACIRICTHI